MLGREARAAMVQQLIEKRERLYAGGPPQTMPVVGAPSNP